LAATVEEASQSPALVDFNKSSSIDRKSLSVRGGCNKGGRFLEVVALMDDDRKGIIWIPESHSRRGWQRFVAELHSLLAALANLPGSSSEGSIMEDTSCGEQNRVGEQIPRTSEEVLHSSFDKVVAAIGPQLLSS
jgi:hypothetical protein